MPVKFIESDSSATIVLDVLEYVESSEERYFEVKSSSGDISLRIEYIPITSSKWDIDRFQIFLFENPYLNAENDVFEIFLDGLSERAGWIFPIAILESNENDYTNYKNLNNYKFIAYSKMLKEIIVTINGQYSLEYYKLSDLFGNVMICLLSKDFTDKLTNFDIENYLLSSYSYGYNLHRKSIAAKQVYKRAEFINHMRCERKRVSLQKSQVKITSDPYLNALFNEHLLQTESHIARFVLLYQVIEQYMQVEFDFQFESQLTKYIDKKLFKNDFKESINNLSKERVLIREVFNKTIIDERIQLDFRAECNILYTEIGIVSSHSILADLIYDIRNLITHSLRAIVAKTESIERLVEIFERLIIDMLVNYSHPPLNAVAPAATVTI